MSFDMNVLSSKPVIQAAANMQNDGGAGNLGYMSQGRKQKEENQEEFNVFAQKADIDTFSLSGTEESDKIDFSFKAFIQELLESIKSLFS